MLICADARAIPLRDGCVDCAVTSPPYWGLRDYGTPGQLGLERTPEEYVAALVAVFREVRRVLKPAGTLWLNLGDSYSASTRGAGGDGKQHTNAGAVLTDRRWQVGPGLKPKDLVGIPWRVAFALQADGWWLRSDVIWSKPNPMPESVTDRPTKAHEYVFLLSKSEWYYFGAEEVAEKSSDTPGAAAWRRIYDPSRDAKQIEMGRAPSGATTRYGDTRNVRTVWTIPTTPYPGAHYAVMPEALAQRCILAGCPPGGIVLDPFVGSGTTVRVARSLGREGIGLDLNPKYLRDHARKRIRVTQGMAI